MKRPRILGLVFVVLLGAALSLSVLQYRKAFTPVTWVTLETAHAGMQLTPGADVKLYGVVVGDVRTVTSDGTGARLRLALDPKLTGQIPADVTARLLPKSLFGERYVALVPPSGPGASPGAPPIRDGAVIGPDRSQDAIELEKVLDDTMPLLQAIQPDKLAATLGAVTVALEGRGRQIGQDIESLDTYLAALNQQLPTITDDVRRLTAVLDTYNGALPDLLGLLRDVSVTARTVVDQKQQLAALLADTTGAADTTTAFLNSHGDQLIQVGAVSRPLLELLATYAPEYPCLAQGLVKLEPRVAQVFSNGRMHITLEVTRDNGKYLPGRDEPVYGAHNGPNCDGLPDPPVPAPEKQIDDGYDHSGSRPGTAPLPVGGPVPSAQNQPAASNATAAPLVPGPDMGSAGTREERGILQPLIGAATGVAADTVPDLALLLWGPLLRGTTVNTP
jgi:phospholipid/cholesterol/gamma-HCH transport system substrate-binding protein